MTSAGNQQGSRAKLDPSETIRRAPEPSGEEIVRAAWRHAEVDGNDQPARENVVVLGPSAETVHRVSNSSERNSLSGKDNLPRRSVRSGRVPAHIGETLTPMAKGNPEGSLRDPLTTDPKGEASRAAAQRQIYATRNTPALIKTRAAYGERVPLDPWFVSGLAEGEGCFCIALALRAKLRAGLEVCPSFSLSLNEKDLELLTDLQAFFGCGWIRESTAIAPSSTRRGRLEISWTASFRIRAPSPEGKQGEEPCGVRRRLPDGRARRSSAAGRCARHSRHRLRDESRKAASLARRSPTGAR